MPGTSDRSSISSDIRDWSERADEALEQARKLPPGEERTAALKLAGTYRNNADRLGIYFAPRGRPRK